MAFARIAFCLLLWFSGLPLLAQGPRLRLISFASGLHHPIDLVALDTQQLLIAQTNGRLVLVQNGVIQPTPFLDISTEIQDLDYNGIFGVCVHPRFATNGYLYVQYFRKTDKAAVIVRYTRSTTNSSQADITSAKLIFTVPYPTYGHRSGRIAFGPDGYLYITTGDSGMGERGSIGDPNRLAQNLQSPFGKLFRIDVDGGSPYTIPPDNPYASPGDGVPDELYAVGLRNPWRWSFDRLTGDLWLADVGQDGWEELTVTPARSPAPKNYGWPCYEGFQVYNTGCTTTTGFTSPLLVYPGYTNNGHQTTSITGGFVYRGRAYPSLQGWYVYGDWSQGTVWTLRRATIDSYLNVQQPTVIPDLVSFGEDAAGELYALSFYAGVVYQLGVEQVASVQSGNWHDPATWDCHCVPDTTADVLVSATHTVHVDRVEWARTLQLRGTVQLGAGGSIQHP